MRLGRFAVALPRTRQSEGQRSGPSIKTRYKSKSRRILVRMRPKAKENQKAHGKTAPGLTKDTSVNIDGSVDVREQAAKDAGVSHGSLAGTIAESKPGLRHHQGGESRTSGRASSSSLRFTV